jgi:3-deoxy-D-manno-octulosonic acid kinase
MGKTRGQSEYEMLERAREMGINVPQPVAYAFRGRLFYQAWLVMEQIKAHQTLAQKSLLGEAAFRQLMPEISRQVAILIRHRFLHVDLHPGNILVTDNNTVYLIDFDKSRVVHQGEKKLCARYLRRWHRAVHKYRLPPALSDLLELELKKN